MPDIIAIGGSAGSLQSIRAVIDTLPPGGFDFTVIIIVHRLRNVSSDMVKILADNNRKIKIKEPEDKESIKKNCVYLAPQNYHLLIEQDKCFSLDYSEPIHHSRPSIDVTFDSVANVYGSGAVGILLSGANKDGAEGLSNIIDKGGAGIVQNPDTADYPYMPRAAIFKNEKVVIQNLPEIVSYINRLIENR